MKSLTLGGFRSMKRSIDAVYENGAFRPLHPDALAVSDGQRVRITVDDGLEPDLLRLAARVYDGLSAQDIEDIENIALDRGNFFGTRSAEWWAVRLCWTRTFSPRWCGGLLPR
jgi:predicted DNA-binding antitoxin AbrB/MazE fold protein